jgi:hypothetical protein
MISYLYPICSFPHCFARPPSVILPLGQIQFKGHMSHVMSLRWSNDDTYLFSVGGLDCCTFQWKHVGLDEPTIDFEPIPNNFGRTMEDPDDGRMQMEPPLTPVADGAASY